MLYYIYQLGYLAWDFNISPHPMFVETIQRAGLYADPVEARIFTSSCRLRVKKQYNIKCCNSTYSNSGEYLNLLIYC